MAEIEVLIWPDANAAVSDLNDSDSFDFDHEVRIGEALDGPTVVLVEATPK